MCFNQWWAISFCEKSEFVSLGVSTVKSGAPPCRRNLRPGCPLCFLLIAQSVCFKVSFEFSVTNMTTTENERKLARSFHLSVPEAFSIPSGD
jgi:hypothetical protein